ncbi:hypothetical protein [Neomoorella glycerini]|uniref:hypothetical protein n=1 Tax=Neomoorella glycerini TaxID=55779 RepID=UPI00147939F9|nr:hypothetical protein [Moorella glycerini]
MRRSQRRRETCPAPPFLPSHPWEEFQQAGGAHLDGYDRQQEAHNVADGVHYW